MPLDTVKRYKAYKIYHEAIARGELPIGPCEVCGATRVEGHHEDYEKPLEVRYFCRKHHGAQDKKRRERERAEHIV